MKTATRLVVFLTPIAALSLSGIASAQVPDTPPPIDDNEPFEERVYTDEPYETMTAVPPTEDPNAPSPIENGSDDSRPPTMAEFEAALNPHGRWVMTSAYGRVWVPRVPFAGWRPYTHGEWVQTAAGWTFVSGDAWGWAPFHYGRWIYLSTNGWCWIPDFTWGPAWVSWRYGGDYVAWAPLGPSGMRGAYYDAPSLWFAVRANQFGRRIHRRQAAPTSRVRVIFKQTRSGGPPLPFVQKATGHPVKRVRVYRHPHRRSPSREVKEERREKRKDRRALPKTGRRGRPAASKRKRH